MAVDEAYSDDGALHRLWPRLVLYREDHPDVDLDDAAAMVAAIRSVDDR